MKLNAKNLESDLQKFTPYTANSSEIPGALIASTKIITVPVRLIMAPVTGFFLKQTQK